LKPGTFAMQYVSTTQRFFRHAKSNENKFTWLKSPSISKKDAMSYDFAMINGSSFL